MAKAVAMAKAVVMAKAVAMAKARETKASASAAQLALHSLQRLVELLKHAVGGEAELAQLGA
jgi:hypothetical protein